MNRVFLSGHLTRAPEMKLTPDGTAKVANFGLAVDTPRIIALLEGQVQDLKEQLDTATAEKAQLLELLSAEKEEKRALMPLADGKEKSTNWLLRLVGVR